MEEHVTRLGPPPVGVSAKPGGCVYACGRDATTDDHIPPDGLLVGTTGSRLKVPSCEPCNGGSSKDDAYFRRTVVPNINAGGHPTAQRAWEKEYRSLQYPEAAPFKRAFYASMAYVPVVDASGKPMGRVLTFTASGPRQGRVAARIARGLYYLDTGGVLPDHYVLAFPSHYLEQNQPWLAGLAGMLDLTPFRPGIEVGGRVLTYRCQAFGDEFVAWSLVFYYGMPFFAMAFPRDQGLPDHWRHFGFPPPDKPAKQAP